MTTWIEHVVQQDGTLDAVLAHLGEIQSSDVELLERIWIYNDMPGRVPERRRYDLHRGEHLYIPSESVPLSLSQSEVSESTSLTGSTQGLSSSHVRIMPIAPATQGTCSWFNSIVVQGFNVRVNFISGAPSFMTRSVMRWGESLASFRIAILPGSCTQISRTSISIRLVNGTVVFVEEHTSGSLVAAGVHHWNWNYTLNQGGPLRVDTSVLRGTLIVSVVVESVEGGWGVGEFILFNEPAGARFLDWVANLEQHTIEVVFYENIIQVADDPVIAQTVRRLVPREVIDPLDDRVRLSDSEMATARAHAERGIARYWSRTIQIDGENFTVNVRSVHDSVRGVRMCVMNDLYEGQRGAHLGMIFESLPVVIPWDSRYGDHFEYTAAHEYGHSILEADQGRDYSITHKGTTGGVRNQEAISGPGAATDVPEPPEEIDLMKYYLDTPGSAGWTSFLSRNHANSEDVRRILRVTRIQWVSERHH